MSRHLISNTELLYTKQKERLLTKLQCVVIQATDQTSMCHDTNIVDPCCTEINETFHDFLRINIIEFFTYDL